MGIEPLAHFLDSLTKVLGKLGRAVITLECIVLDSGTKVNHTYTGIVQFNEFSCLCL